MKKQLFFMLMFLISAISLKAQDQTFTQMVDSVFMHVSKSDATTGILYNRVLPFSGLYRFTQSDTAKSELFIQAYQELFDACFTLPNSLPFVSDSIESKRNKANNIVDIGVIHYKYNVFDDSVVMQKLYFDQDSVIV